MEAVKEAEALLREAVMRLAKYTQKHSYEYVDKGNIVRAQCRCDDCVFLDRPELADYRAEPQPSRSTRWYEEMRQADPSKCWAYLDAPAEALPGESEWVCIQDRGHDAGAHEPEPQGWQGPWPHLFGHSAALAAEERRKKAGARA